MHFLTFVAVNIPPYVEDFEENKKVEQAIEELKADESKEEIMKNHMVEKIFLNTITKEKRESLYSGWKKAIEATRIFK